jgi:hypothetical protein
MRFKLAAVITLIFVVLLCVAGCTVNPGTTKEAPFIQLYSSWAIKSHVYEGSIHFHSTNSDGADTPEQMSTAYRAEGFNFTVLSDHHVVTSNYTPAPDILAISGEEITTCEKGDNCAFLNQVHTLAIGITHTIGTRPSSNVSQGNTQTVINDIVNQGGLAALAHPAFPGAIYTNPLGLQNYTFVETQNYTHPLINLTNAQVWQYYDTILSGGKQVWALRDDDAHEATSVNRSATMVNADRLTKADIMANLKAGNYYVAAGFGSTGTRGMARISSITTSNDTITIKVPQNSTIQWIKSGGVVAKTTANVIVDSYKAQGDEGYVRIVVSRSDYPVAQAWSQPIFVALV